MASNNGRIARTSASPKSLPVFLLAFGLSVAGCDCSDPLPPSLTFVRPVDGASLSLADDADMITAGVQYDVRLSGSGISSGTAVSLLLDPSAMGVGGTMLASSAVAADGTVTIRATLPNGDHRLVARTAGNIQSNVVTYTLRDSCGTITFLRPMPSGTAGGPITLGPTDDTDGMACGATFQTTVEVSTDIGDGAMARLTVNGTPRGMATVAGTLARFTGVALDNRGTTPNTIGVEITRTGVTCRQDFPGQILVDCEGASCAINFPTSTSMYLNSGDDMNMGTAGFQSDFTVMTDASGLGQAVDFIIDGDSLGAMSMIPAASGMGGLATFGNVSLTEGTHNFRARCRDSAGNETLSSIVTWTVDTIPCEVAVTDPAADQLIVPTDDVDAATTGTQIDVTASVIGADCDESRIALCTGIMAAPFAPFTGATITDQVTLASSAMQDLCAEVRDTAGNVSTDGTVRIRFRSDAPQLEISNPTSGTSYNVAGDATHRMDLNPASSACEAAFSVYCTDVGVPVTLHMEGDTTPLAPSVDCTADAGAPAPYNGSATFASVSLTSVETGASFNIVASQTADGLTGDSVPVSLTADCILPMLSVTIPTCGSVMRPATEDEDTGTPGFQHRVVVVYPSATDCPTLRILSGGTTITTVLGSAAVRSGASCTYTGVNFGAGGVLDLAAEATDSFGNRGVAPSCSVTVADLPTLSITTPAASAILGPSADCNAGAAGFQLHVRATTDAADGSAATVRVGTLATVMTTVSGGVIDACTDAPQGTALPVVVSVTDTRGTANASLSVTIDSLPPTSAITDLALGPVTDARGGCLTLTWTAVADAGGGTLNAYRLRCASAPISSEATWSTATPHTVSRTPSAGGMTETDTMVCGFRPGESHHCTMRGEDVAGSLTPIGNDVAAQIDLRRQDVTAPAGAFGIGNSLAGVGDVNGDGIDDFLAGGVGRAVLYFGAATLHAAPDVTFIGVASEAFGRAVAGIGDFDGDGRNDIAIGARSANGFTGNVFVFYGRASWAASYNLTLPACGADICIHGDDGTPGSGPDETARFGASIAGIGDFDGDGRADLAVGAPGANGFLGRFYVLRGSAIPSGSDRSVPGVAATRMDGFFADSPTGARSLGNGVAGLGRALGADTPADLIVGAPGDTTTAGRAFTVAGRAHPGVGTGLTTIAAADLTFLDMGAVGAYGASVTNVGDYDGNGQVDIGVWDGTGVGFVSVYLSSGGAFSAASKIVVSGVTTGDQLGFGGAALGRHPVFGGWGDLDRDGLSDLSFGSINAMGTPPGAAYGYYGRATPVSATAADASYVLRPTSDAAGTAARRAEYVGDVNGDMYPDIVVGDPAQAAGNGRLVIYY